MKSILIFYFFLLANLSIKAQVQSQLVFNNSTGVFTKGSPISLTYKIQSNSNITGQVVFLVYSADLAQEKIYSSTQNISLTPQKSKNITLEYLPKKANFYRVKCILKNSSGWIDAKDLVVGYAIENIFSAISRKTDFEQFWQNTRKALDKISPEYKIIPKKELWTQDYKIFLIEMKSLDNVTIRGWYRIPRDNWDAPVVLQLPALGNTAVKCPTLTQNSIKGVPKEFAVFCLDIRGHGLSRDEIDLKVHQYFTWNLEDKEKYFYRGAIADCMRAIDFLSSKPELNPKQIIVEGASQGGGLALILAGLDNRIALCAVDSPFLSDFESYFKSVKWPLSEVQKAIQNGQFTEWRANYHLTFFDTKNFASYIKCPILMSVGLQDLTCPPITAFSTYNKITSKKKYYVYPYNKHEGGGAKHRKIKFEWVKQELKL